MDSLQVALNKIKQSFRSPFSRNIQYFVSMWKYDEYIYIIQFVHVDQTWGESTFNDSESESDSGRLFDSESDSSQFGYDSESNSDSSNISISDSESDSNFQLLIWNYC